MKIRNFIIAVLVITNLLVLGYSFLVGQNAAVLRTEVKTLTDRNAANATLVVELTTELKKIARGDSSVITYEELENIHQALLQRRGDSLRYVLASAQLEREYWQTRALECDSTLSAN